MSRLIKGEFTSNSRSKWLIKSASISCCILSENTECMSYSTKAHQPNNFVGLESGCFSTKHEGASRVCIRMISPWREGVWEIQKDNPRRKGARMRTEYPPAVEGVWVRTEWYPPWVRVLGCVQNDIPQCVRVLGCVQNDIPREWGCLGCIQNDIPRAWGCLGEYRMISPVGEGAWVHTECIPRWEGCQIDQYRFFRLGTHVCLCLYVEMQTMRIYCPLVKCSSPSFSHYKVLFTPSESDVSPPL